MEDINLQKPCIVETKQGFSVSYNNKLLYSKYNPSKLITNTVESLQIQPGTIFLCNSPALLYGLSELLEKLPENCMAIACEFNKELYDFTFEQLQKPENSNIKNSKNFYFPTIGELYNLPVILNKTSYSFENINTFSSAGNYRRVISLDFSAGTSFEQSLYNQLQKACQNSLMTFWGNRVTLTKFGRKYSAHFLQNLKNYCNTEPIENYFASISKPILVFGAGESIDKGIQTIKNNWSDYFIICTDTSLTSLLEAGIEADCVFVEEAQQVISKTFIGTKNHRYKIFAGLSSLPQLYHNFGSEKIVYFTTEYANASFITNLEEKGLLPAKNNPFGSVGLTAVYYALQFRKDSSVPVYVYGLDFSYSAGKTHGKGTMAHKNRLMNNNRLVPVQNYGAAYSTTAFPIADKNNNIFYTTQILSSYANLFNQLFIDSTNLFDAAESGIKLNIPAKQPAKNGQCGDLRHQISGQSDGKYPENKKQNTLPSTGKSSQINNFIQTEISALESLRDILSGVKKLSPEEAEKEITELCKNREYLYLHFPDGWQFKYELSFLKRIRSEIDYFLKVLR